jgi:hypothetical protein
MSYDIIRTHNRAGQFSPGDAVGDGSGRRWRRTSPKTRTEPVTPTNSPIASADTVVPASGRRPLRRWSVAELIARAVAAPTAERMSHC